MSAKRLLLVNANVNRATSRTERLTRALVAQLLERDPELELEELVLEDLDLAPLDSELLARRYALVEAGRTDAADFDLARSFRDAYTVVFSAPYWFFTYPAKFKAYLEAIDVVGVLYDFMPDGSIRTHCRVRSLYYATTAGYRLDGRNFGYESVRAFAETECRIPVVRLVAADGLDLDPAQAPRLVDEAIAGIPSLLGATE